MTTCRDDLCDRHKGRGHCAVCATPWGCFRDDCGCHTNRGWACQCGAPLYVAPPRELSYDIVLGSIL